MINLLLRSHLRVPTCAEKSSLLSRGPLHNATVQERKKKSNSNITSRWKGCGTVAHIESSLTGNAGGGRTDRKCLSSTEQACRIF